MADEDKPVYDWEKLREELNKDSSTRLESVVARVPREWEATPQVLSATTPGIYPVRESALSNTGTPKSKYYKTSWEEKK